MHSIMPLVIHIWSYYPCECLSCHSNVEYLQTSLLECVRLVPVCRVREHEQIFYSSNPRGSQDHVHIAQDHEKTVRGRVARFRPTRASQKDVNMIR